MTERSEPTAPPERLLDAAIGGDADAFDQLVTCYRAELHAHCYRMLGSFHDAEDALQETLTRAWRALPRFAGPKQLRPWLYRIATNVCLDAVARRPERRLPTDHGTAALPGDDAGEPLHEPVWVEPYPDERIGVTAGYSVPEARYDQLEAIELAFIAAVQYLPATQRAVLILRDVLGFSARETAEMVKTTVASVNSALQRARATVEQRRTGRTQQATLRALGDGRVREIVERYIDAWERGDVRAIAAMLAEDATFAMPPYPMWWRGRDTIAAFATQPVHRYLPTHANGQLANAAYRWHADEERYVAEALEVLTLDGSKVKAMTAFMAPEMFRYFGLPDELPAR